MRTADGGGDEGGEGGSCEFSRDITPEFFSDAMKTNQEGRRWFEEAEWYFAKVSMMG